MDSIPSNFPQDKPHNNIPNTSGIYKITCIANKRIYIGSAVNLRIRRNNHFSDLRQNKHINPILQNAWNKYGEQNFIFEVLELVLPMSLTAREQYWFNNLKPFGRKGFNIAPTAGSTLGRKQPPEEIERRRQARLGKKLSPEHIEKLKQVSAGRKPSPQSIEASRKLHLGKPLSPEHREKIRQANLGKKKSSESIEKRSQARIGKPLSLEHREKLKGRKRSPETREKMRQAKRGKQ